MGFEKHSQNQSLEDMAAEQEAQDTVAETTSEITEEPVVETGDNTTKVEGE